MFSKVFFKKEIIEAKKTGKFLLALIIIVSFAIMSPILLKLLPFFMEKIIPDGMLNIESDYKAAYISMAGETAEIGLILLIIYGGLSLSGEMKKGTLENAELMGLKKHTIIYTKFIAILLLSLICIIVAGIFGCLTVLLCYGESIGISFFIVFIEIFIYGMMALSMIFLMNTIFKSTALGFILPISITLLCLSLSALLPQSAFTFYNPAFLLGQNASYIYGEFSIADTLPAVILSLIITIINMALCFPLSKKKFSKF